MLPDLEMIVDDVHVPLGGVRVIGVAILVTGSVMRLRAAVAARVGRRDSIPEDGVVVVRRIESDARRAAPTLEVVGVSIALAGFLGWFVTE
jgi:hypothetical protein